MESPMLPDAVGGSTQQRQIERICRGVGRWLPGLVLTLVIGMAGYLLASRFGGSAFLYALLLGLLCHPLAVQPDAVAGMNVATRFLLPAGIALMALQVTFADLQMLGWETFAWVVLAVVASLFLGYVVARLAGLDAGHSFISAAAVSICGASAAVAISSVLSERRGGGPRLAVTVAGVTALSAVAMVIYPPLVKGLGLSEKDAAVFLGASIHDVAQVVAAGYALSPQAGETATLVKLVRVAMLVPVVAVACVAFGGRRHTATSVKIPVFLYAFIVLIALNSTLYLPPVFTALAGELSFWCILAAVAAAGVKTSPFEAMRLGTRPVWVMTLQSLFVAAIALAVVLGREGAMK